MAANFSSKLGDWQARHKRAVPAALEGAALVVESAVKRAHTPIGYTSRLYATGRTRNSITHSKPVEENGAWVARVGSNLKTVVWWTLGHFNTFSGRWERVDLWTEPVLASRAAASAKFVAIYRAMMGAPGAAVGEFSVASVLPGPSGGAP